MWSPWSECSENHAKRELSISLIHDTALCIWHVSTILYAARSSSRNINNMNVWTDLVSVARQNMQLDRVVGLPRRRKVKVRRPSALQLPPVPVRTPQEHLQTFKHPIQTPLQSLEVPHAPYRPPTPTATPFELRPENRPFQVNETVGSKPEFAKRCKLPFPCLSPA